MANCFHCGTPTPQASLVYGPNGELMCQTCSGAAHKASDAGRDIKIRLAGLVVVLLFVLVMILRIMR